MIPGFFAQQAMGSVGGASDPYFSQRVALLHCNGPNLGQTFVDVKGKTWTPHGSTAYHDNTQARFGVSSINLLSISEDRISAADDADFHFGTGDFKIEFWYYPVDHSFYKTPIDYGYVSSGGILLQSGAGDGKLNLYVSGSLVCTESSAFTDNAWNFYEINRVGSTCRIFRNGTQTASGTSSASIGLSADFNIGGTSSGGGHGSNGFFDDIRITKGSADQNTSGYAPPVTSFPNS